MREAPSDEPIRALKVGRDACVDGLNLSKARFPRGSLNGSLAQGVEPAHLKLGGFAAAVDASG